METNLWLDYDIYGCGSGLDTDHCGRKRPRKMQKGGRFDRHGGQYE